MLTVSATLVHPLTETRLPTLAQTSAWATPEGCTTAYISGIHVRANTVIPAAVQDRIELAAHPARRHVTVKRRMKLCARSPISCPARRPRADRRGLRWKDRHELDRTPDCQRHPSERHEQAARRAQSLP